MLRRPKTLIITTILGNSCGGILGVVFPRLAKEVIEATPALLGYYGFTQASVYMLSAWISGRLGDRYGFRKMLSFAFPLLGISVLLPVFILGKIPMFFAFGLTGLAYGFAWPCVEAALIENQTPAQLKRATGIFNYSWMSSMAAGGLLGSVLYEIHYALPLYLAAGAAFLVVFLVYLPRAMEIAPWGLPARFAHSDAVPIALQRRFILFALIANLVCWITMASFRVLLPEFTGPAQITGWRYGLLSSGITIGMFLANGIFMRMHGWHYSLKILIGAELAAVALLIGFVFTDSYALLVVVVILLGFPAGLFYFSSLFYGMELSEKKGAHGGNHESLIGVGMALGPPLGGWLITLSQSAGLSFASRANLIFCAACFVAAAAIQIRLAAKHKK